MSCFFFFLQFFVVKFLNENIDGESSDEDNDVCFDVGHRKWLKERNDEKGNAVVYWPPKSYLASIYAKKGKDPEDDWLICTVQIKRWYSE